MWSTRRVVARRGHSASLGARGITPFHVKRGLQGRRRVPTDRERWGWGTAPATMHATGSVGECARRAPAGINSIACSPNLAEKPRSPADSGGARRQARARARTRTWHVAPRFTWNITAHTSTASHGGSLTGDPARPARRMRPMTPALHGGRDGRLAHWITVRTSPPLAARVSPRSSGTSGVSRETHLLRRRQVASHPGGDTLFGACRRLAACTPAM